MRNIFFFVDADFRAYITLCITGSLVAYGYAYALSAAPHSVSRPEEDARALESSIKKNDEEMNARITRDNEDKVRICKQRTTLPLPTFCLSDKSVKPGARLVRADTLQLNAKGYATTIRAASVDTIRKMYGEKCATSCKDGIIVYPSLERASSVAGLLSTVVACNADARENKKSGVPIQVYCRENKKKIASVKELSDAELLKMKELQKEAIQAGLESGAWSGADFYTHGKEFGQTVYEEKRRSGGDIQALQSTLMEKYDTAYALLEDAQRRDMARDVLDDQGRVVEYARSDTMSLSNKVYFQRGLLCGIQAFSGNATHVSCR